MIVQTRGDWPVASTGMTPRATVEFSVVIPVLNEEKTLPELCRRMAGLQHAEGLRLR